MVAQIWLNGRGRESGVEVKGVEAGHLVRFRELKIIEFVAFASLGPRPRAAVTRGERQRRASERAWILGG